MSLVTAQRFCFQLNTSQDDTGGIVGANKLSACCGDDLFVVESGLENTWAGTELMALSVKATMDFDNFQMEIIAADRDLDHSFNNDYSEQPVLLIQFQT